MTFKKSKYNIIFLLMFMLVIGVFGVEVFFTSQNVTEIVIPGGDNGEEIDPPLPDNPDNPNPDDPSNPVSPVDPGSEARDPKVPGAKYPVKIIEYALNKLYTSAGYKSNVTREMANTALSVTVTQKIKGTIDKCGDVALENCRFDAEGSMANLAANYIRCFYYESDKVTKYQTPQYNYDISSSVVTEMTRTEYFNIFGIAMCEKPVFNFKDFTCKLQTLKDKAGKEYYVITASAKDTTVFTENYIKYYESTGDLKNVAGKSMTCTFYIYKSTGRIFQIIQEEVLTGTNPSTGFAVTSKVKSTQAFTAYTTPFEIKRPI